MTATALIVPPMVPGPLAMDKVKSKLFFSQAGLSTPDYAVLRRGGLYEVDALVASLGEKTVVKPANEGSSVGMTIVHDSAELPAAIDPPSWAAYLTSVTFIVTLMIFLEGFGGASRKIGLFLALIFSIVATVLTVMHWREEK